MTIVPWMNVGKHHANEFAVQACLNPVCQLLSINRMDPISYGLPHREPFIFIESVDRLEPGSFAACSKTFNGDEPFFQGHFPGNAIVPGVLLTEGMAQTAGIAVGGPGKIFLLTAIRSLKFLRPVRPEELILFSAQKLGDVGGLVQCAVQARVGNDLVCEGQIILAESTAPEVNKT